MNISLQIPPPPPPPITPLDEEEHVAAPDPTPQLEAESATEEAEEDTSGGRRRVEPRNAINLTEEEKEIVIDFQQQNPMLYSKRLAGYKGTAARDRLWVEQAMEMSRTSKELKTWYESMRTKLGKLKKAITKTGQAADRL